jgi:hypothetical protein
MPAFLTHWRVLVETARHSQDAGSDLGSLIIDATALRRRAHGWSTPPQTSAAGAVWDTGPLPEIDFHFPGSDISAMAFLGALAPDIFYYHHRSFPGRLLAGPNAPQSPGAPSLPPWSDLLHTSHSGELPVTFLEQVALVPSPALRSQALAFALGYISHIAADLALNPWIDRLAAHLSLQRASTHFLLEQRLDEYLATTYFHHPRYSLFHQPWGGYIEPAARSLSQPDAPAAHMLQLLAGAAEIYHLAEEQTEALPDNFLQALRGLRSFLAGRGKARWLMQSAQKKERQDGLNKTLEELQDEADLAPFDQVLGYATRLSEHLCRRAISYYTALRNPNAGASERSSQRATLHKDLRNWNLVTGSISCEPGEEPSSPFLHNWTYFASFWEQDEQGLARAGQHMLPTS